MPSRSLRVLPLASSSRPSHNRTVNGKARAPSKQPAFGTCFDLGTTVFYGAASRKLDSENRVEYGLQGEVTDYAPVQAQLDGGRRVMVQYHGNSNPVACLTASLRTEWPPPPLPGGFEHGEALYFCGASEVLPSGEKLEHGAAAVVAGAAIEAGEASHRAVAVHFPGHATFDAHGTVLPAEPINCFVSTLCRQWPPPPLPGLRGDLKKLQIGDMVYYSGVSHTFSTGDELSTGAQGEVAGAAPDDAEAAVAVRFPENRSPTVVYVSDLSRTSTSRWGEWAGF